MLAFWNVGSMRVEAVIDLCCFIRVRHHALPMMEIQRIFVK